ncbi:MAG TPA: hypothetical protein PL182_02405, partial [Pseudobdellovibrionaceae bacterium]|nr:hypothetical protein [Pseudobdellovibrionaceae bacterium]
MPAPPDTDVPMSEEADVPPDESFFARLEKNEADLIRKLGHPRVARDGRTLTITTSSGKVTQLKDCLDCGPEKDIEHYLVTRFSKPDAVLIYRQLYEGDDYTLITDDGVPHQIPSYPVFSPDRKAFVVVSASEAFNWNGLEMWQSKGSSFERKLHYEPKVYEIYRFLGWDGNDRVRLEYSGYTDGESGSPLCRAAEIRREGAQWKVNPLQETREGFCPFTEEWLPEYLRRYVGEPDEN